MNLTRAIVDYLDGLGNATLALRAPSVLVPFVAFAVLQCLILLAMASFIAPPLAPVMVPFIHALGGEESLHYPLHLVRLPAVYQRVYLPLVATVGFSLWTLAVWLMVDHHVIGSERAQRPFRAAIPNVLVVGVLFVGASVIIGELAARLVSARTHPMLARGILLSSVLVTACVQALLIYAPVALRLRGGSAWSALKASTTYARRRFVATALVIVTVFLVHAPVDFLLTRADRIAARFQPEAILYLLLASAVLEMVTAYLMFAATTELALRKDGGLR